MEDEIRCKHRQVNILNQIDPGHIYLELCRVTQEVWFQQQSQNTQKNCPEMTAL